MSEAVLSIPADDPVLQTTFAAEMLRQMRAIDTYDIYEGWPAEKILAPFVLTKEQKRAIPIIGDPDDIIVARIKAFYNTIAILIEKECGHMAAPVIHLSHEGFGRALIVVGKLVVLDRTLRDVHRFGFDSLSKMKDEADKYLSVALQLVGQHADVAQL